MTYFELLEQNTNDPDVQFALYEACLAGEDGGTDDADAWLKSAADNGHKKALALINQQRDDNAETDENETSAVQENADERESVVLQAQDTAIPDRDESAVENVYEQMSLQELYAKYQTEYGAAKQLLHRIGETLEPSEKKSILECICSFEACTVEDYEQLFEYCYQTGEIGHCKELCEKAAESGSALAVKRLAELELYEVENVQYKECAGDKLFAYAQNGTFIDKAYALIVYQYSGFRFKEGFIRKMIIRDSMQKEELERFPILNDVLNERFSHDIYDYILHSDADLREKQLLTYYIIVKSRILQDADALKKHANDQTAYTLLQKYEQLLKLIEHFNLQEGSELFESLAIKVVSIYLLNIRERIMQENIDCAQKKMQQEQQLLQQKAVLEQGLAKLRKKTIFWPCAMVLAGLLSIIIPALLDLLGDQKITAYSVIILWLGVFPAILAVGIMEIRKASKDKYRIRREKNEINRQLNGIK